MNGGGGTSSASSGERILREINEGSLFQLLCDVRCVVEPENDVQSLHIRQVDDFIHVLNSTIPTSDNYPVLELTSASSAAGKTSLLYYIAAKAVLPKILDGIDLSGSNAAVVFIDTDKRFDANRLRDIALGIVLRSARKQGRNLLKVAPDRQYLLKSVSDALQHVHVFRPSSSAELLTTLIHLSSYLLQQRDERGRVMPKHHSTCRPVHSIFIDSASAFYYQDARANGLARLVFNNDGRDNGLASGVEPDQPLSGVTIPTTASATDLVSSLRQIQRTFRCVVIFTTWGLYPRLLRDSTSPPVGNDIRDSNGNDVSSSSGQNANIITSFKPYLPGAWLTYPTCRLILRREQVKRFSPNFPLGSMMLPDYSQPGDASGHDHGRRAADSIRQSAEERQSAVRNSGFIASLDTTSVVGWNGTRPVAARSQLHSTLDRLSCCFKFNITKSGVEIDDPEN